MQMSSSQRHEDKEVNRSRQESARRLLAYLIFMAVLFNLMVWSIGDRLSHAAWAFVEGPGR
jgi:hypothetical protein